MIHPNKQLSKKTPFDDFTEQQLFDTAQDILKELPVPLEEAQHHPLIEPLTYIWSRLDKTARRRLNREMNQHAPGLQPIYWLPRVKSYVEKLEFTKTKGGSGHVYFILMDQSRMVSLYRKTGIYIGQSRYTPEKRFQHHLSGINSSGSVRLHGKFLLQSLSNVLTPISIPEARRLEAVCLEELRSAGLQNLPAKNVLGS